MKAMKDNRDTILGNVDIIGIFLIAIATLFVKPFSMVLYQILEAIGGSLIFAELYANYKLAKTKRDKTFFILAMVVIMCACVSIFNWK